MPRAFVLVLAALAAPLAAQPLQTDAAPVAGVHAAGPAAVSVPLTVRADVPMPRPGCAGYVDPSAPDAVVEWGGGDLRITVEGSFDATLAVAQPGDGWTCDDDSAGGLLPEVTIEDAAAGRYAVWVGAFSDAGDGSEATLVAGPPPPPPVLGADAAAASAIDATDGFAEISEVVRAGGPSAAADLEEAADRSCAGYIDADRPSALVTFAPGESETLAISATPADDRADLVLVVRTPDGDVDCNDDFGGPDPLVVVEDAAAGDYAVWVGTYGRMDPLDAVLTLADTAPETAFDDFDMGDIDFGDGGGFSATPYGEGSYLELRPDVAPSVALAADDVGGSSSTLFLSPEAANPVTGDFCRGYIETTPTAGVALSGEGPFAFTASGDRDLTLTLRTPSGDWWCSDDADGLDPGIQIDDAEAGAYLVWVGTYGEGDEGVEVTVAVEPGIVERADDLGGYDGRPTQSDGVHDGSVLAPGPGQVALAADGTGEVMVGGPTLNPVDGDLCQGFVSTVPTATVEVTGPIGIGASPLAVSDAEMGGEDLTIVARGADGAWTCGDDDGGPDPYVVVDGGPGTVTVWVGTYSRRTSPVEATVYAVPVD